MTAQNVATATHHDDATLLRLAQQGDVRAYQCLYDMYVKRVYSLAYRLTADAALAEDATQEVFIQVWQKLDKFQHNSKFSTWLYSVTSNVTISYMRKQKGWLKRIFSSDGMSIPETGEADTHVELDRFILRLPEQTRVVFVLHALQGLRHEDIATQLKIAVGTSKAQFHRAKGMLEEMIDGQ
jgi:RNA polymerase sigma-70 factor (ECF subfamily)